jgi:hypothetical protein
VICSAVTSHERVDRPRPSFLPISSHSLPRLESSRIILLSLSKHARTQLFPIRPSAFTMPDVCGVIGSRPESFRLKVAGLPTSLSRLGATRHARMCKGVFYSLIGQSSSFRWHCRSYHIEILKQIHFARALPTCVRRPRIGATLMHMHLFSLPHHSPLQFSPPLHLSRALPAPRNPGQRRSQSC